jgi:ankyrin repeat protein
MLRLLHPADEQPPDDPQLVEAVERGDVAAVRERLAAGAFADSCHATGHTCLMIAACSGNREIFEALLDRGADPYRGYQGDVGGTALDFAAMGESEIVEAWLARGLDVNLADGVGNTPLMAAAAGGHVEIVRRLLAAGADMNARTVDGITAYSVALHGKHQDVAALLREAGARFDENDPLMAEVASFESTADHAEFEEVARQLAEELVQTGESWAQDAGVYAFEGVVVEPDQWDRLHQQVLWNGFHLVHTAHNLFGGATTLLLFPTKDKYAVIRACGTDGGMCDVGTREIVAWLKKLEKKEPFELLGCGQDFIAGRFLKRPRNARQLANKIHTFCPDVVEQGSGTVSRLADELARTQRFVLWWD